MWECINAVKSIVKNIGLVYEIPNAETPIENIDNTSSYLTDDDEVEDDTHNYDYNSNNDILGLSETKISDNISHKNSVKREDEQKEEGKDRMYQLALSVCSYLDYFPILSFKIPTVDYERRIKKEKAYVEHCTRILQKVYRGKT